MARKLITQNVCVCRSVSITERIDMFLRRLTNAPLFLYLLYLPLSGAEDIFRAVEGATVHLLCPINAPDNSEQVSVEWTKNSINICNCNINKINGTFSGRCIDRFTVTIDFRTLRIENVHPSDSGTYNCKISRLIPPPTLDKNSSLKLQVAGLSLKQLNNTDNSSCVHLLCSLEEDVPEPVSFSWSREGQMISHTHTSELRLCKPEWSDGDTITCHVNYSNTQSQKSIQLNPKPDEAAKQINLVIIGGSALTGLILFIVLPIVICKCKKTDENGSIVFTNKVYENFSYAMSRQNTQFNAKPQAEECIYEN